MIYFPNAEAAPRHAKSPADLSASPHATAPHQPPPGPITESTSGASPHHQPKHLKATVLVMEADESQAVIALRGSVDSAAIRDRICALLEGGEEAFRRRAERYRHSPA